MVSVLSIYFCFEFIQNFVIQIFVIICRIITNFGYFNLLKWGNLNIKSGNSSANYRGEKLLCYFVSDEQTRCVGTFWYHFFVGGTNGIV